MKYLDRYAVEGVRAASYEELRTGEALFMADMAAILTAESIKEGVHIDFGSDKERFEEVLGIFQLDAFIAQDKMYPIGVVVSRQKSQSFISQVKVREALKEHGTIKTLEALHVEDWKIAYLFEDDTDANSGRYPYITTKDDERLVSEIMLGSPVFEDENAFTGMHLNPDSTIVTVRQFVQYTPTATGEYGYDAELPYLVKEYKDSTGKAARRFEQFLEQARDEGLTLRAPESVYTFSITGTHSPGGNMFSREIAPRAAHLYEVKNDRIVPWVDPNMFDDDEI